MFGVFGFCFSFFLCVSILLFCFFFFNDTATTEIYTLSLHDALPIYLRCIPELQLRRSPDRRGGGRRSEEHTSELQSHHDLVCRLLLEKKNKSINWNYSLTKKTEKPKANKNIKIK